MFNEQLLEEISGYSVFHPEYNRDKTTNYVYRYKYIAIYDSYNNPWFPYKDIIYDKSSFDLPKYKRYLNSLFGIELDFLPFHFYIEYVENDYYIFTTRPLLLKPIFLSTPDDYDKLSNSVHICILGDTNTDIYDKSLYQKLKSLIKHLSMVLLKNQKVTKTHILDYTGKNFYLDKILM